MIAKGHLRNISWPCPFASASKTFPLLPYFYLGDFFIHTWKIFPHNLPEILWQQNTNLLIFPKISGAKYIFYGCVFSRHLILIGSDVNNAIFLQRCISCFSRSEIYSKNESACCMLPNFGYSGEQFCLNKVLFLY